MSNKSKIIRNYVQIENKTVKETIIALQQKLSEKDANLRMAINQYEAVVKQNRSLQSEHNLKQMSLDNLYSLFEAVILEINERKEQGAE